MPAVAGINVACSGAFRAAYLALVPAFEAETGHRIATVWGASIGDAPTSIPSRLRRGEDIDLVILSGDSLDRLVGEGLVAAGSRADLARSGIGVAVRAGAPRPDIGSREALVTALLQARSIAHSSSASGVYLRALLARLGLADALAGKVVQVEGEPVGRVVARGEAEIGFQQVSELIHAPGVAFVGAIPDELQPHTFFSAGLAGSATQPEAAAALIRFLASPEAAAAISDAGLAPLSGRQ